MVLDLLPVVERGLCSPQACTASASAGDFVYDIFRNFGGCMQALLFTKVHERVHEQINKCAWTRVFTSIGRRRRNVHEQLVFINIHLCLCLRNVPSRLGSFVHEHEASLVWKKIWVLVKSSYFLLGNNANEWFNCCDLHLQSTVRYFRPRNLKSSRNHPEILNLGAYFLRISTMKNVHRCSWTSECSWTLFMFIY